MERREIIEQLQQKILTIQGNQKQTDEQLNIGLGQMESAFPGKIFPRGALHELISFSSEDASCTNGFISVVLGKLMQEKGCCIWISNKRKIFPPALKMFGIDPEHIVFVDTWKTKDILWTIEEAMKCDALTAVVGEIDELSFNDSRRLQLVAEKSKVTGFLHRQHPKTINALACVSRWKVTTLKSSLPGEMPGVGFPNWEIELLKVKNGNPDKWQIQWSSQGLKYITQPKESTGTYKIKIA
ncbi:MAG: Error-prone repair protein ImuA [Bacteroidetes bacterium]|jgi:protein ImuA|nr:Error-prone repair protein ImuA [Bacteroidota bacterium]MDF2450681.1 Error-prone repair protein ImuA [Bacteroidota bacterium]